MKKPKLLLLDADVVIACHELGIWETLKSKFVVHVPSIVADEARFAGTPSGQVRIDLHSQIARAEVTMVEATATEIAEVVGGFVNAFAQALDDGETEGLAIVARHDLEDCKFCTGDTNALQAIGMLAFAEHAISLERVLELGGIKIPSPLQLRPHLHQQNWAHQVQVGTRRRISGEYFSRSPLAL